VGDRSFPGLLGHRKLLTRLVCILPPKLIGYRIAPSLRSRGSGGPYRLSQPFLCKTWLFLLSVAALSSFSSWPIVMVAHAPASSFPCYSPLVFTQQQSALYSDPPILRPSVPTESLPVDEEPSRA
jgi:hypothetical protein